MSGSILAEPAYRSKKVRHAVAAIVVTAGLLSASTIGTLALDGTYEKGEKVGGGGGYEAATTFEYGTYAIDTGDTLYQYATGKDGNAYYNTYEGDAWSGWQGWDAQPAKVTWDPAPVVYNDTSHAFYTGDDGHLYYIDGESAWSDISGDNTYASAPYANAGEDGIHVYASADDGYVYHRSYSEEAGWDAWAPVNDTAYTTPAPKPYAVSWGDYENTFWTGDDGKAYWNRYSYADKTWSGAKEINGSADAFTTTPYAVGYAPEKKLYAYSVTAEGKPAYNVFDGKAWAGWETLDVEWTAAYQPNAYVYEDAQHIVYTSDDGHAYYTTYGADGWAGEWEDLGDNYGYDSQQYAYNDGLYLTYTGEDGEIYYKAYSGGGGTIEPTPTPGY